MIAPSAEERAAVLHAARTVVGRIVQVVTVLERDLGLTDRSNGGPTNA